MLKHKYEGGNFMAQRYNRWGANRTKKTWIQVIMKQIIICIVILLLVIMIKKLDLALVNGSMQTFRSYMDKDYTKVELIDSAKTVFSHTVELPKKINETLKNNEKKLNFVPPTDEEAVLSTFGEKKGYLGSETNGFERGMKFSSEHELQVYAVAGGTVSEIQDKNPNKMNIQLTHGNEINSRYEGCTQVYVEPLQKVKKGQLIASIEPNIENYLAFELWVNEEIVNPAHYISF